MKLLIIFATYGILDVKSSKDVPMSPRLPRLTAVQLLRALRRDVWEQVRQSGSHVTLQHTSKPGSVTVPKHATVIIKIKTLESIMDQAGLTVDELRRLL